MSREVAEQVQHDHVVEVPYREYHNYPSLAHPHLLTYFNHPYKSRGARDEPGNELFPDIVVYWLETDKLMLATKVETESTVNYEEAQEREIQPAWSKLPSVRSTRAGQGREAAVQGYESSRIGRVPQRGDKVHHRAVWPGAS
ncbi:MAG: hypothetical protein ABIL25_01130 [candidate division WOR-3 bacterium]